jgi:large subunit ribosomal protein L14
MIQTKSFLKVADNSGATLVECVRVYRVKDKNTKLGNIILVSIKEIKEHSKLKLGSLHQAIIVRIKTPFSRRNGNFLKFDENAVILLNSKKEFFGNRFFGLASSELRQKKSVKFLSLISSII